MFGTFGVEISGVGLVEDIRGEVRFNFFIVGTV